MNMYCVLQLGFSDRCRPRCDHTSCSFGAPYEAWNIPSTSPFIDSCGIKVAHADDVVISVCSLPHFSSTGIDRHRTNGQCFDFGVTEGKKRWLVAILPRSQLHSAYHSFLVKDIKHVSHSDIFKRPWLWFISLEVLFSLNWLRVARPVFDRCLDCHSIWGP